MGKVIFYVLLIMLLGFVHAYAGFLFGYLKAEEDADERNNMPKSGDYRRPSLVKKIFQELEESRTGDFSDKLLEAIADFLFDPVNQMLFAWLLELLVCVLVGRLIG